MTCSWQAAICLWRCRDCWSRGCCAATAPHRHSGAPTESYPCLQLLTPPPSFHRRWTQFDHITSVMKAYGAGYDMKVIQPSEVEGGANALNLTEVRSTDMRTSVSNRLRLLAG